MPRMTVYLQIKERDALFKLAQRERRKPQEQGALFIRQKLEELGILPTDPQPATLSADPEPQPRQPREMTHGT